MSNLEKNLIEAYIKVEKGIDREKVAKQKKNLWNFMFQGAILQALEKERLFEKGCEPMLFWSNGTPMIETHKRLRTKLGFKEQKRETEP